MVDRTPSTEAETLKPCPFCGGKADVFFHHSGGYWYGSCLPCDSEGPPAEDAAKAATAWNARSAPEPSEERPVVTVNGDGEATKVEFKGEAVWTCGKLSAPYLRAALAASKDAGVMALKAAGEHAERVLELEAEVSTLRDHLAEQNRLLSLNVAEVARLSGEPSEKWRCFHCDETFTDEQAAYEHFGAHPHQEPGCKIDLAEYRRMESEVARMQRELGEDDTMVRREMARQQGEHAAALRRAEETGYARGLKDAGYSETKGAVPAPSADADDAVGSGQAERFRASLTKPEKHPLTTPEPPRCLHEETEETISGWHKCKCCGLYPVKAGLSVNGREQ